MSEGPRDDEFHVKFDAAEELQKQAERAKVVLTRLAAHLAATEPHRDDDLKDIVERLHVIEAANLLFGSDITPPPFPGPGPGVTPPPFPGSGDTPPPVPGSGISHPPVPTRSDDGSGTTPSPAAPRSVFISYSHRDKDFVTDLRSKLDDAHVTTFVADRDIQLAADWAEGIWEAIRGCRVFVSILTPRFVKSRWFHLEAGAACSSKKIVLPVLRKVKQSKVKPPFDRFKSMTVKGSRQLDELVEKLRELCR